MCSMWFVEYRALDLCKMMILSAIWMCNCPDSVIKKNSVYEYECVLSIGEMATGSKKWFSVYVMFQCFHLIFKSCTVFVFVLIVGAFCSLPFSLFSFIYIWNYHSHKYKNAYASIEHTFIQTFKYTLHRIRFACSTDIEKKEK